MSEFKVGDWVTWGKDGGRGGAYRVRDVQPGRLDLDSWGSLTLGPNYPEVTRVRVTPVKTRKLTLSAALAWLQSNDDLALTAWATLSGKGWGVWHMGDDNFVTDCWYETPLKAIIAARRALGVK